MTTLWDYSPQIFSSEMRGISFWNCFLEFQFLSEGGTGQGKVL